MAFPVRLHQTEALASNKSGRTRRVRASESAIAAAIRAATKAGLTVDKMCITGSRVDIHMASRGPGVETGNDLKNDDGLEQW